MERLSDAAIEIINTLHRERIDYNSEYLPLIDAVNRLSAYEDTGLEPDEIKKRNAEYIELTRMTYGPLHQKMGQWLQANMDGRLVVLPCKVGDTVYIASSTRGVYEAKVRTLFCGHCGYSGDFSPDVRMIRTTSCDIPMEDFNKTVFLTREEAEAAMREKGERGAE